MEGKGRWEEGGCWEGGAYSNAPAFRLSYSLSASNRCELVSIFPIIEVTLVFAWRWV